MGIEIIKMEHTIDINEKECSKCKKLDWVLPNGLCMSCHNQNLKNSLK